MATERIQIVIQERGGAVVRRRIDEIGSAARRSETSTSLLRRSLGLLGVGLLAREVKNLSDGYTNMQNRLKLVTSGTEDLARTTEAMFDIANRTRLSVNDTAEGFTRFSLALKESGRSQQEVLRFTESVNKAIILSGASSAEASAGLIQFSQGLAAGALRGDEFRSVSEQLPIILDVISDHTGRTRAELREMSRQGLLTADLILDAFEGAADGIDQSFGETVPTIGQALTVVKNNIVQSLAAFQEATNLFGLLAQGIVFVGGAFEHLGTVLSNVGKFFTTLIRWTYDAADAIDTLGTIILAPLVPAIAVATVGVEGLTAAWATLMAVNPAFWVAAAAGAVALFHDELVDATVAVFDFIDSINPFTDEIESATVAETIWFRQALKNNELMIQRALIMDRLRGIVQSNYVEISTTLQAFRFTLQDGLDAAQISLRGLREALGFVSGSGDKAARSIGNFRKEIDSLERSIDPLAAHLHEWIDLEEKLDKAVRRGIISETRRQELMDLRLQQMGDLIRKSKAQVELEKRLAAQRGSLGTGRESAIPDVDPTARSTEDIKQGIKEQEDLRKANDRALKKADELTDRQRAGIALAREFSDTLVDALFDGDQSAREFIGNLLEGLAKAIAKALALKLILSATGLPSTGQTGNIGALFGFQHGGSFIVGGTGGPDSQPVAFMASPNERVTIETPQQQRQSDQGGAPVNVKVVTVSNAREAALEAQRSREGEQVFLEHARANGLL